jgi:hypothetical protein
MSMFSQLAFRKCTGRVDHLPGALVHVHEFVLELANSAHLATSISYFQILNILSVTGMSCTYGVAS